MIIITTLALTLSLFAPITDTSADAAVTLRNPVQSSGAGGFYA